MVIFAPAGIWAKSFFIQGEELLLQNKLEEAAIMFEAALAEEPKNEKIYLYLGFIYEQQKRYDKAIGILQRGASFSTVYPDTFYFNLGNNFFAQGKNMMAVEMYTKAVERNAFFHAAYLNRANAWMKLESYDKALEDYKLYLQINPATNQREGIERIIAILSSVLEAKEAARLAAEEARQAEEQRQRALLNEVLNSLQNASSGTQGLSAGSGTIETVEEEDIDIAD
jgi:tetratricopeptide (TPR) repeat protein